MDQQYGLNNSEINKLKRFFRKTPPKPNAICMAPLNIKKTSEWLGKKTEVNLKIKKKKNSQIRNYYKIFIIRHMLIVLKIKTK